MFSRIKWFHFLGLLIAFSMIMAACQPQATEAPAAEEPEVVEEPAAEAPSEEVKADSKEKDEPAEELEKKDE